MAATRSVMTYTHVPNRGGHGVRAPWMARREQRRSRYRVRSATSPDTGQPADGRCFVLVAGWRPVRLRAVRKNVAGIDAVPGYAGLATLS